MNCRPNDGNLRKLMLVVSLLVGYQSLSQCSPEKGPPPSNRTFNTGGNGNGRVLSASAKDLHWKVAIDSITAAYNPAVVMSSLPTDYYKSPWSDCTWISVNSNGNHTETRNFFYKIDFNLPCSNPCGKSYNSNNSFCLSLDLFADNSIFEIYVNGIPQSANLGHLIPVTPDPYHGVGMIQKGMISVSLCNNWKAGENSLVIQVASSAPATGFLAQASTLIHDEISNFIVASICEGEVYHFANHDLTSAGYAFQTFHTASGCDSTVAINLNIKPKASVTINKSICIGETYLGYNTTGTYLDTFIAANGCDSIRTVNLSVNEKPIPKLETNTEFCTGDSLKLFPGEFLSYKWQDSSTGDHLIIKKSGLYSVTVTNSCGSSTQEILVKERQCDIYFPGAFTPNKDGKNDNFKILTNFTFQEYHLIIYNRWGQVVFETTDSTKGWDGTIDGSLQQSGNYVWECGFKRSNITTNRKGTVMLIR